MDLKTFESQLKDSLKYCYQDWALCEGNRLVHNKTGVEITGAGARMTGPTAVYLQGMQEPVAYIPRRWTRRCYEYHVHAAESRRVAGLLADFPGFY